MTTTETIERLKQAAEEEKAQAEPTEEETEGKAEKKSSSTREYIVLGRWEEIGKIEAANAAEALKKLGKKDGKYAVAPSRNWNVFSVTTETVTTTSVSAE